MKLSLGLTPRDYSVSGGATYDADALAYFTANTAITSDADKNAINTFYLGLKSDGIYTKIIAMYLPIWSSATANKWNMVNSLDTNAAYRLNFATGMTHSSTGMTSNGTTGYADTFFNPSLNFPLAKNFHFSFYSQTQVTENKYEMGAIASSIQQTLTLNESATVKKSIIHGSYPTNWANSTDTNTKGFQIGTRLSNTDLRLHFNNVKIATNTSATGNYVNAKVFICAINHTSIFASTKTCSFSSLGNSLTDTEASNFYTRVNTLMTYFGINV